MYPEIENKNQQQMLAYREMADEDLFTEQWVQVSLTPSEFPGLQRRAHRLRRCGEGINYDRFVEGGRNLCHALRRTGESLLPAGGMTDRPRQWTAFGPPGRLGGPLPADLDGAAHAEDRRFVEVLAEDLHADGQALR